MIASADTFCAEALPLRLALFTDTYTPQVNGVARTLERLAQEITARGGAVEVFTTSDPAASSAPREWSPLDTRVNPRIHRFSSRAFWAYPELQLALPQMREVELKLRAFKPTLVHSATEFGMGLAGRRVARKLGIPFVSSYHTNFTAYAAHYRLGLLSKPGWSYLRWFHNGGERTYCPTSSVVHEVEQHGFERCRVWSRGVDVAQYHPRFRSGDLRKRMGADDDTVVVTYVGRLASEKGLDVALDAMRRADSARPGRLRFAVVGDGPYAETVRARATPNMCMLGTLRGDALSTAFASSDLLIFPSTTDTFGNVMLEAMASGVPVLGADVGPTRELLSSGRGRLAVPGNVDSFARHLVHAVDDRASLQRVRTQAYKHARNRSWTSVWDNLFADYARIATGPLMASRVEPSAMLSAAPGCTDQQLHSVTLENEREFQGHFV